MVAPNCAFFNHHDTWDHVGTVFRATWAASVDINFEVFGRLPRFVDIFHCAILSMRSAALKIVLFPTSDVNRARILEVFLLRYFRFFFVGGVKEY